MKIALLTDGIWPDIVGGMQKHSYYLCKYLAKQKVYIDLFYTSRHARDIDVAAIFGKDSQQFVNPVFVPNKKSFYFPGHYLWNKYRYSKAISQKVALNCGQYDLVYAQGFSGWHFILNRNKFNRRIPVVLNFHGLNMFQDVSDVRSRLEQFLFKPFAKRLILKADYVQSLGGKLTELLIKQGISKKRIAEFGIGIEDVWLAHNNKKKTEIRTFVFIGRYDKIKGISELYRVLSKLGGKYSFKFIFVGPFPKSKQLKSANIEYAGIVRDEAELMIILDNSDFLVLPSYSEGMPTVILEAMARRCAVIATDVGAVSTLVSEENGTLIQPSDVAGLSNAILQGIEMDKTELYRKQEMAHRKIRQTFLWENLISEMLVFFNQMEVSNER